MLPPADEIQFSVLGPVRMWRGEQSLPTGTPHQQALLAVLLLRGETTVTAAELIDAVWGDDPPDRALASVRIYASRLRTVLTPDLLVSEEGGYRLQIDPDNLDLHMSQKLTAMAERVRADGDLSQAREYVTHALALWKGEPLDSVPGPYAENQRARLEELRLRLLETRIDLDLELGRHAEVVPELTALTAAHPLRERLRELLMLALYRSGRQAE
ncbi:BTAD domain-containing putative transcriptional regulator, partial [Streptomyces sp. NPDC001941]|uniref:AfsR/SARP family transcriptional regulator n=1 Tax=Streptomyces sp. NPDC001941 TaxID=3154659 RepID=UPI00331F89E2